jgi:3-hydroxyacyl-CoA dehydrogenase
VQKEHSGWDTTCAVAKIIWPDLCNAKGPPPVLQKNVDEGRIGFKTKRGFFEWNDESMAKERARYERALRKCLEIFREEGSSRRHGRDRGHHRRRRSDGRRCRAAGRRTDGRPCGRGV